MQNHETRSGSLRALIFSLPAMPDHYNLWSKGHGNHYTYAIVNGAGSDKVLMNLIFDEPEHRILYHEEEAELLEEAAPWLVRLNQGEPYTEWLLEACFGKRLLLFLQSKQSIDTLAEHFRHYTKIEFPDDQDGWQPGYFSFYDPAIFPAWAMSLTKEEAMQFYAPLSNIWYEDNEQLKLLYIKPDRWQRIAFNLLEEQQEEETLCTG